MPKMDDSINPNSISYDGIPQQDPHRPDASQLTLSQIQAIWGTGMAQPGEDTTIEKVEMRPLSGSPPPLFQ